MVLYYKLSQVVMLFVFTDRIKSFSSARVHCLTGLLSNSRTRELNVRRDTQKVNFIHFVRRNYIR